MADVSLLGFAMPSSVIVAGCSLAVVGMTFVAGYLVPGYFGGSSHGPYVSTMMLMTAAYVSTLTCIVATGWSLAVLATNPALRTKTNLLISALATIYSFVVVVQVAERIFT